MTKSEKNTGRLIPTPVLWGVDPTASPPCYEILFRAQLDDDHRIARVPFTQPITMGTLDAEALQIARRELDSIPVELIAVLACSAQLIDRAAVAGHEQSTGARSQR